MVILRQRVRDGELRAIRSCDPPDYAWRLSLTHWPGTRYARKHPRLPYWSEIADARAELLPSNIEVVLFVPHPDQIIHVERSTLHLREHRGPPRTTAPEEATDPPPQGDDEEGRH